MDLRAERRHTAAVEMRGLRICRHESFATAQNKTDRCDARKYGDGKVDES